MSEESPTPPAPTPPRPAHHLYHKEKPPPRTREHAPAAERPPEEAEAERDHRSNPAVRMMLASLHRFGLVIVGMVLLMLASIVVLRLIWSYRDRQSQLAFRPTLSAAADTNRPAAATTTNAPPVTPTDLNTEAIRRAVFLAKHAESLERSGKTEEAMARYREALDIWPYLTTVWGQLGRLYLRGRDYPRAQIALEKAVENAPSEADLLNDLGVSYLYQGKLEKARNLFDAAMEIDPLYAPSLFNLALCHASQNDRGPARDALVRFLRIKPDDARALRELAFLDALESRYDDAMDSLEKALARSADWPLLYFDAAAVSALMGRPDQAISYLEKAEPLTDPSTVYRLYQEPAFREIRLTELGKMFEEELAKRARERVEGQAQGVEVHTPAEPMHSVPPTRN